MAVNDYFERLKKLIGGIRSDTPPTTADGDFIALRVNQYGEPMIASGSAALEVQGDTAHDATDAGNPVKIGGFASAAEPASVGEGDRVNASFNLEGRLRTDDDLALIGGNTVVTGGVNGLLAVGGNVAHDAEDAGNPVKIGGRASTNVLAAVANNDRVDASFTLTSRLRIDDDLTLIGGNAVVTAGVNGLLAVGGNIAHDDIDAGYPLKIGGTATTTEAAAVANGDRVQAAFTLAGRQRVDDDLTLIGGTAVVTAGVNGLLAVGGNIAHDTGDAGNPVKIGAKASTSEPAAVANNDRVDLYADEYGYLQTKVYGSAADDAASDATNPVKIGAVADDVVSAVADDDAVHLITDLYRRLRVIDATYDSLQDANAIVSRNGPEQHYEYETLLDEDNIAQATYYYYWDMSSYRKFGFQFVLGGTPTITLEGTVQADGTVPASCTYDDITNSVFGVANWTASGSGCDNAEKTAGYHYLRFKLVTTAGDGDDVKIWIKKLY